MARHALSEQLLVDRCDILRNRFSAFLALNLGVLASRPPPNPTASAKPWASADQFPSFHLGSAAYRRVTFPGLATVHSRDFCPALPGAFPPNAGASSPVSANHDLLATLTLRPTILFDLSIYGYTIYFVLAHSGTGQDGRLLPRRKNCVTDATTCLLACTKGRMEDNGEEFARLG